jgi:hypothetical protein
MNHQQVRLFPSPRPRRTLRLLCLLVSSRAGEARSLPIFVLRAKPPRTDIQGRWEASLPAGLVLRETQARAPRAEVLARCIWQWRSHALPRAVRQGALSRA